MLIQILKQTKVEDYKYIKQKEKLANILIMHEKVLLNRLMIILQLELK